MEHDTPKHGIGHAARTTAAGTAIAVYAFFDVLLVGLPIAALAAWLNPLIVFVVAGALVTLLNIACCNWIQRQWDSWIAGSAERLETKLDKMRKSRLMRHPVAWITRGSDAWYTLAATMVNAIIVAALARLIGGQPVSERRILFSSVAYSIFFTAVYSITGLLVGVAIRGA